MRWLLVGVLIVFVASGCQTTPRKTNVESSSDVISAVGTMAEGLTNKDISPEDLKRLGEQLKNDPQAKSAVESVNSALQAKQGGIRYCPVDGKRFSDRVTKCPYCGALLKDLE